MITIYASFIRQASAQENVRPHYHHQPQWYHCRRGLVRLMVDDEWFDLRPGDHLIVRPGASRALRPSGRSNTYAMVRFTAPDLTLGPVVDRKHTTPQECISAVDTLCQDLADPARPLAAEHIPILVYRLMLGFLREHSNPGPEQSDHGLTQQVDATIRNQLAHSPNRDSIAAALHCSASHLARRYRAATGHSLGQRLKELRLERAAELLLETDMALSHIPEYIGLASYGHFCQLFSDEIGCSPSAFRRAGGAITWTQKPTDR